jgi:hypothetical protein
MDSRSHSPEKSRPKLGPSSSLESRHPEGKGRLAYSLVTEVVSKLGRKGMRLNMNGSLPALDTSYQGVNGSSQPASRRSGVAGTSCLMACGVGTSHARGGGTRGVNVGGVCAIGGTPGVTLMPARSLARESMSSIGLGASPRHGVP